MEHPDHGSVDHINMKLDERAVRALSDAVEFTLNKWAGQEDIDQEALLMLKFYLQGCCLEFNFHRPDKE